MKNIHKIVITGGPCGGKTTGMAHLKHKLENAGFTVFIVPEAATLLINAGFFPGKTVSGQAFQTLISQTILTTENNILSTVCSDEVSADKIVLLYDRGMMDGAAYVSADEFESMLKDFNETVVSWRDERYDAVMHLVTAANGAEEYYTLENNEARTETPEQARELDMNTQNAWVGHPHLRIIDNSVDFEGKMEKLHQEVFQVLGIPVPIEKERKFLVQEVSKDLLPDHCVTVDIEQIYIVANEEGAETRVRKRGQNGSYTYYRTTKKDLPGSGRRAEFEEIIDEREYIFSSKFQIPGSRIIRKRRTCFLYEGQYFELDCFHNPEGLWVLEIELTEEQNEVMLPPFIQPVKEVTDDPDYKNVNLAFS